MPWSSRFISKLSMDVLTPIWIVETARFGSEPYSATYSIASQDGYGDDTIIGLGGPTIKGPRLTVSSWGSSVGQFTIPIAGNVRNVLRHFTRGSTVVVRCGFLGWDKSDFEVVAVGRIQNIAGRANAWTITCNDMLAMLESRFATNAELLQLFYNTGTITTLTSAYTVGDATLNVTSTSGFEKETGGSGTVNVGDAFYLSYTGSTGTTLTGCSATGQFGTTAANTASGNVTEAVLLSGHPLDIVRRLLLSTGGGGNSAWDDYPEYWGWGIPQPYVDIDDIQNWATYVVKVSSGSYQWDIVEGAANSTPGSWLAGHLAKAGIFLTIRHGIITCRGGQAHVAPSAQPLMPDIEITDADIVAISIQQFDGNASIQYGQTTVQTSSGTTVANDAITTIPAVRHRYYDLTGVVFTNEAAQRTEVSGRLTEMSCRIPMAISIKASGMRLAELTPGDVVPLTTARVYGRTSWTIDGFEAHRCYVAQVSPNWQNFDVTLLLLAYPTDNDVFPP